VGICQHALEGLSAPGAEGRRTSKLFPCERGDGHVWRGEVHEAHAERLPGAEFFDRDFDGVALLADVEVVIRWRGVP